MTETLRIQVHPVKESRDKIRGCLTAGGFLTVAEGSVRSGKTCTLLMAFAAYVVRSPERVFLLSGRTVKTAEQNCILERFGLLNLIPGSKYGKVGESRTVTFSVRTEDGLIVNKKIVVVGAADIRAYMMIRGNTYGGWMADEVNMHDPEFVSEALRRTAMSTDRRHYFSLNPDHPNHWFYRDYLDRYDAMTPEEVKDLGGYTWWHFTPKDNPAMTPEMIRSLEMQYPQGTYLYDRYILGLRCMAEGLIYPKVTKAYFQPFDTKDVDIRYCAIDFGTDHPTVMVFGGMLKGNRFDWRLCAEYFDKGSDKTTYDHYVGFLDTCQRLGVDPTKIVVAVDPAAKVMRLELQKHGIPTVKAKNDVLDGINFTRQAIYQNTLSFHPSMVQTMREFSTYSWDPKASERGEDKPIKIDDDCMDAVRYFAFTHMKPIIGMVKQ